MNRGEVANSFNAAHDSIDRVFNELFFASVLLPRQLR